MFINERSMYRLTFTVFSLFLLCYTAENCSKNWLAHVDVLNKEQGYLSEVFKANVLELKNDSAIMVLYARIPILCEGMCIYLFLSSKFHA